MIAMTFDIVIFISRGGDCVQGMGRILLHSTPRIDSVSV
jgi:hypothetical protein